MNLDRIDQSAWKLASIVATLAFIVAQLWLITYMVRLILGYPW